MPNWLAVGLQKLAQKSSIYPQPHILTHTHTQLHMKHTIIFLLTHARENRARLEPVAECLTCSRKHGGYPAPLGVLRRLGSFFSWIVLLLLESFYATWALLRFYQATWYGHKMTVDPSPFTNLVGLCSPDTPARPWAGAYPCDGVGIMCRAPNTHCCIWIWCGSSAVSLRTPWGFLSGATWRYMQLRKRNESQVGSWIPAGHLSPGRTLTTQMNEWWLKAYQLCICIQVLPAGTFSWSSSVELRWQRPQLEIPLPPAYNDDCMWIAVYTHTHTHPPHTRGWGKKTMRGWGKKPMRGWGKKTKVSFEVLTGKFVRRLP